MTIPTRNRIFDKIREVRSLTDVELSKSLAKDELVISAGGFNKVLLDLEVMNLIKVSWLTKDTKRIELVENEAEEDPVEAENRRAEERDYEASFPGAE
jgi:hypothetical protein